jgi:hypothetical protein
MPLDSTAADVYGNVRAELERQGTPIGSLDTLIAAHAMSLGIKLVTNSTTEFARVALLTGRGLDFALTAGSPDQSDSRAERSTTRGMSRIAFQNRIDAINVAGNNTCGLDQFPITTSSKWLRRGRTSLTLQTQTTLNSPN